MSGKQYTSSSNLNFQSPQGGGSRRTIGKNEYNNPFDSSPVNLKLNGGGNGQTLQNTMRQSTILQASRPDLQDESDIMGGGFNSLDWEENEKQEEACVQNIIAEFLNPRKVKGTDEYAEELLRHKKDLEHTTLYKIQNLAYEIKNCDSNGRSLLHRAALDHKAQEIKQILQEYQKWIGKLDVNEVDYYGNTALILACIQKPQDEEKLNEQISVVQQLLDFNLKKSEDYYGYDKSPTIVTGLTYVEKRSLSPNRNSTLNNQINSANTFNKAQEKQKEKAFNQSLVKVNMQNDHTLFTALHWACRHGNESIVRLLLDNGAKQFILDKDGFYPLDYAGLFKHENVLKLLIEHHLRVIESIQDREDYAQFVKAPYYMGEDFTMVQEQLNKKDIKSVLNIKVFTEDEKQNIVKQRKKNYWKQFRFDPIRTESELGELAPMMFSPIFNTRMLYWSTFYPKTLSDASYHALINGLESYPEGSVFSIGPHYRRSPIHAAAKTGNIQMLRLLLEDVRKRYQTVKEDLPQHAQVVQSNRQSAAAAAQSRNTNNNKVDINETIEKADPRPIIKKGNIYPFSDGGDTWYWHMGQGKQRDSQTFIDKLKGYQMAAVQDWEYKWKAIDPGQEQLFTYDFLDSHLNTPLHLAVINGHEECIRLLTMKGAQFKMREDLRNIDGHTPIDIMNDKLKRALFHSQHNKTNSGGVGGPDEESMSLAITTVIDKNPTLKNKNNVPQGVTIYDRPFKFYPTLRDIKIKELYPERHVLPRIPKLVLKVDVRANDPKKADILNSMLQILKFSKFQIQMVQSVDLDIFYVGLDLSKHDLEKEAQEMNIKLKVFDIDTKRDFTIDFKTEFEPFRSKDVQTVLWRKLQREINIPQYKNQGVIMSIIPMHNLHELYQMKKVWYRANERGSFSFLCLKFNFLLMPISLIKSFIFEGSEHRYTELSAVRNYFGEKVGFQYAWMSFYTVWLTLPALAGIALTIFQMAKGVDTPLTTIYALFVCIWVTVFIERWKRKSAEICLKWGLVNMAFNQLENRVMRDEFNGYEAFSHETHKTEKRTMRSWWLIVQLIAQIPIYLILIGLCIGSFILQQYVTNLGRLALESINKSNFNYTLPVPASNITVLPINSSTNSNFTQPIGDDQLTNSSLTNLTAPLDPLLVNVTAVIINATLSNITVQNVTEFVNTTIVDKITQVVNETVSNVSQAINNTLENVTQAVNDTISGNLNFLSTNQPEVGQTATKTSGSNSTESLVDLLVGFINAIFIEIFDYLYSLAATYFVEKENHKFLDSYEKSYVFKMFIFKFINTNISIFYTAFILNRMDLNKFDNLYYMLLAMAGTKAIKIFFLKHVRKILEFRLFRFLYFRKVRKEGFKQKRSQQCYSNDDQVIHQKSRSLARMGSKEMAVRSNPTVLMNKESKIMPKDDKLQRLVFSTDPKKAQQRLYVDYIELNDRMKDSSELLLINERTDVFIIFGLATLYSCACPVVPLIAMVHNIIDMNMDLYVSYTSTKRPLQKMVTNIGPWLSIAEFMAFAAVVSNCLLLYFSTNSLFNWLKFNLPLINPLTDDTSAETYRTFLYLLWVIVGVEHIIVLVKQLTSELVPDVPGWVQKAQQRVGRQELELQSREEDREMTRKQQTAEAAMQRIRQMQVKRDQMMQEIQKEIHRLKDTVGSRQEEIERLKSQQTQMQEELRIAKAQGQKAAKDAEQKLQKKFGLSDFLQINSNEWLAQERGLQLDIAININLQKKLIRHSFSNFEREIMSRRIGKLYETKSTSNNAVQLLTGGLQINCAQCQAAMATIECIDCLDHFCKICCDDIHRPELEIAKEHKLIDLNMMISSEKLKVMIWKKFEYFNFPIVERTALYSQLQLLFNFLKSYYLNQNYIDSTTEPQKQMLQLKSFFLDRNYHLLTDIQSQIQHSQDDQLFGQPMILEPRDKQTRDTWNSKQSFNDEELFYINLIANYLIQHDSFTFQEFTKTLGILQSGTLLKRATLWFKLLQATMQPVPISQQSSLNEEDIWVTRRVIEENIRFSFVQKRPLAPQMIKDGQPRDYRDVVNIIFSLAEEVNKEEQSPSKKTSTNPQNNEYQRIHMKKFIEIIAANEDLNDFFTALLQYRAVSNFVMPASAGLVSITTAGTTLQTL